MSDASITVTLDLPLQEAWAKLSNLSLAHHYVPGIVDTRITSANATGVGASRNVYQKRGGFLQETVTEWNEGHGFTLRLHKGEKDAPFRHAGFTYALTPEGDSSTRATLTMRYEPPMGMIGGVLDGVMLKRIITGVITDVAWSMKFYYETGKTAGKSELKLFKKSAGTKKAS
jgi:hypothetical protein